MQLDNIEELKKYFDSRKGATFLYPYLAEQYMKRDKIKEARKICKKGLKIYPQDPTGHYIRGLLEKRTGNIKNYIQQMKKCIQLDNGFLRAYYELITEGDEYITDTEMKNYHLKLILNKQSADNLTEEAESNISQGQQQTSISANTTTSGDEQTKPDDIETELEKLDDIGEEEILNVAEEEDVSKPKNVSEDISEIEEGGESEGEQYNHFMKEVSKYEDFDIEEESELEPGSEQERSEEYAEKQDVSGDSSTKDQSSPEDNDQAEKRADKKEREKEGKHRVKNIDKLKNNFGLGLSKELQEEDVKKRIEMIESMFNAVNREDEGSDESLDIDMGFMENENSDNQANTNSLTFKNAEDGESSEEREKKSDTRVEIRRKTKNKLEEGPDKVDLKIPVPTMTFVDVLVKQELFDQALDVLDVIQKRKSGMEEEVEQKRKKIMRLKSEYKDEEE